MCCPFFFTYNLSLLIMLLIICTLCSCFSAVVFTATLIRCLSTSTVTFHYTLYLLKFSTIKNLKVWDLVNLLATVSFLFPYLLCYRSMCDTFYWRICIYLFCFFFWYTVLVYIFICDSYSRRSNNSFVRNSK